MFLLCVATWPRGTIVVGYTIYNIFSKVYDLWTKVSGPNPTTRETFIRRAPPRTFQQHRFCFPQSGLGGNFSTWPGSDCTCTHHTQGDTRTNLEQTGRACNPCGTVLRQVSVKSHVSPFTAPCDALSVIPSPSCSPIDASTALPPHGSSAELPQTSPTGAPPPPYSPRRAMEVLQRVLPKVRAALGKKDYQICDVCLAPS